MQTDSSPSPSPIHWVTEVLSPGEQRPKREANHSLPFNTEVKNKWSFPSAPLYAFSLWIVIALGLLDVLQMFDSLTNK
jgi:hypothetical protein